MACGTLGQIGSMNSCLALVGVLEDEDPSVSRAAREALTAITGLQIPDDAVRARSLFQSP
jgi:HEAT repeat protein